MIDEDLAFYALKVAGGLGASYAEARIHVNRELAIIMRNGRIIGSGIDYRRGIGVRVIVNGALGFSATNKLDK